MLIKLGLAWLLADVRNALTAIPNLIGLPGPAGEVVEETRRYFERRDP